MLLKLFTAFIVIIAVVVGLLSITPFHLDVIRLAVFNEFFNAALPILGFGALVKFFVRTLLKAVAATLTKPALSNVGMTKERCHTSES